MSTTVEVLRARATEAAARAADPEYAEVVQAQEVADAAAARQYAARQVAARQLAEESIAAYPAKQGDLVEAAKQLLHAFWRGTDGARADGIRLPAGRATRSSERSRHPAAHRCPCAPG